MSYALSAAVTGMKAHQTMLDVAGNNLANVNTIGYKSTSVTFAELLSQTVKRASAPSGNLGGTNPQQKGTGVGLAAINRNLTQGNIISTGQDLDAAIDGQGYFVLTDGEGQEFYTRIGSFSVDANNSLVDPGTGYKVQRSAGVGETFQTDNNIHIPWDTWIPANQTTEISMNGNLRTTAPSSAATTHDMTLTGQSYTTGGGTTATATSTLAALDQWSAGGAPGAANSGTLTVDYSYDGGASTGTANITIDTVATNTLGDVADAIASAITSGTGTAFTGGVDSSGRITLTADSAGYGGITVTDMTYTNGGGGFGDLSVPTFCTIDTEGGNDTRSFTINVFDENGGEHTLTGTFLRTDTNNQWDLVINSISGETSTRSFGDGIDWRIEGLTFNNDGSYAGMASASTPLSISATFGTMTQAMAFDFGTIGEFSGLTQFDADQSSANALRQDGYGPGKLSSVSIDQNGTVVGLFTNGERQDIAMLKLAVFQNPQGLEAVGDGYYQQSSNSGLPQDTTALTGGAGAIKGKSLEKSNVDVATEFVNMMQAQNGFQANARTISVANDVLRELTNIIR